MAGKETMTAAFEPTIDVWKVLEGKPIEYIVVNPVTVEARLRSGEVRRFPQEVRERIVRCRDCKYAEHYESGLCGPFILCGHFESEGCKAMVDPDGFCAWGEERDA